MLALQLNIGDKAAVMPSEIATPDTVLDIGSVSFTGSVYVQLHDGRMFGTIGGNSLGTSKRVCIVPATAEHFAALQKRGQKVSA